MGPERPAPRLALPLCLASASPRRRSLLAQAGLAFEVVPSDVDETVDVALAPCEAARELARRKARAVARRRAGRAEAVLAADTIVAWTGPDGRALLLGKPSGEAEARAMLRRLSGSRHEVVTGVCARRADRDVEASAWERTWVTMRPLSPAEVDDYVASGEWRDKAGGYAIQESADRFVTRLEEGGFDNVVGLPVALALRLLRAVGALAGDGGGDYPLRPPTATTVAPEHEP